MSREDEFLGKGGPAGKEGLLREGGFPGDCKSTAEEGLLREGGFTGDRKSTVEDERFGRDRKSTRLNSSHVVTSRMPSSA